MRRWAFRLVSVALAPLLVIALLETGLRLVGAGYPTSFTLECVVEGVPSFCDNPAFTRQFFPPKIARTAPSFAFPVEKEPDAVRIFVLGGSAAQGDPDPTFGFSRILAMMLRDRYPETRFEVVNTAITAVNSHVVRKIANDLADRQGDLFVVYMGNNEVVGPFGSTALYSPLPPSLTLVRASLFWKATRMGQLASGAFAALGPDDSPEEWRGMEMFLKLRVPASHPRLPHVYAHFRRNLESIIDTAVGSAARVVVTTVPVNLRDCSPFASQHREELDDSTRTEWEARFQEGLEHVSSGRLDDALHSFTEAESLDDAHGELQYRMARAYLDLGNHEEARKQFSRAVDLDVLRFRADSRINEIVRSVTGNRAGSSVRLFDAERAVQAASPQGLPGSDLFLDHVHPTFSGNYLLARGMLEEIDPLLPERARGRRTDRPVLTEAESAARIAFTELDRRRMTAEVRRRVQRAPFTHQSNHDEELERLERELERLEESTGPEGLDRAAMRYIAAIGQSPEDPWLRFNFAAVLERKRDLPPATEEYRSGLRLLPQAVPARERLASVLAEQGRFDEALDECRFLIERHPQFAPPHRTKAYSLANLGKLDDAVTAYRELLEIDPASAAEIHNEIGRIRLRQERIEEAVDTFREAVEADRQASGGEENPDVYFNFGFALKTAGRTGEARTVFGQAVEGYRKELERHPGSVMLNLALGRTLSETGDLEEAARRFREAAAIEPASFPAHAGLLRTLEALGRHSEADKACTEGIDALELVGLPEEAARLRAFHDRAL